MVSEAHIPWIIFQNPHITKNLVQLVALLKCGFLKQPFQSQLSQVISYTPQLLVKISHHHHSSFRILFQYTILDHIVQISYCLFSIPRVAFLYVTVHYMNRFYTWLLNSLPCYITSQCLNILHRLILSNSSPASCKWFVKGLTMIEFQYHHVSIPFCFLDAQYI